VSVVPIGSVIDSRYRIIGELGQGGMGTVYKAEHVTIRRPVALKLLDPLLGKNDASVQRFEREAFAAGRIDHPNCVTVSDFGNDGGVLYLVMELVKGRSLTDLLEAEGKLSVPRALHVARHIMRGISHAHKADIVHRDIKPDNILLVERDGDQDFAKILDFGIAKLLGEAEQEEGGDKLTQAGFTVGTPSYLSPEQAFGEEIDKRTDLYSATVVLYEMISGRPPFMSDDKLSILSMHVGKQPPPFSETAPGVAVPPEVEALVMWGLTKKRGDRIQTAVEYLAALDRLLAAPPRPATPLPVAVGTPPIQLARPADTPTPMPAAALPTSGTAQTHWAQPNTPHPGTIPITVLSPKAKLRRRLIIAGVVAAALLIGGALFATLTGTGKKSYDAYVTQLKSGKTCEERKAAVAGLRALGDKRALKPLKKARYRMRGGFAGIGDSNTNKCLKDDADAAITYLEGL